MIPWRYVTNMSKGYQIVQCNQQYRNHQNYDMSGT